jgi:hypothetical protein
MRIAEAALDILGPALREAAPRRTGRLVRGIEGRSLGSQTVFTSSAPYTKWVIGGTGPHSITAGFFTGRSSKKALSWAGIRHPTRSVWHPGTSANNFPARAKDTAMPALLDAVKRIAHEIASG